MGSPINVNVISVHVLLVLLPCEDASLVGSRYGMREAEVHRVHRDALIAVVNTQHTDQKSQGSRFPHRHSQESGVWIQVSEYDGTESLMCRAIAS